MAVGNRSWFEYHSSSIALRGVGSVTWGAWERAMGP